jgi:hypothetical protein
VWSAETPQINQRQSHAIQMLAGPGFAVAVLSVLTIVVATMAVNCCVPRRRRRRVAVRARDRGVVFESQIRATDGSVYPLNVEETSGRGVLRPRRSKTKKEVCCVVS